MGQETIAVSIDGQTAEVSLVTPSGLLGLDSDVKLILPPTPCIPLCVPACVPSMLPTPCEPTFGPPRPPKPKPN